MIIMKFGGTSVEDARAMRNVAEIVERYLEKKPVVVSSACAGVTNGLLKLAKSALEGGRGNALEQVEALRSRHQQIARELISGDALLTIQSQIDAMMDELRDLVKSIAILGELTNRSLDTFASFGERLSTLLLCNAFKQRGMNAALVSALEVMITNADFTHAVPMFEEIDQRAPRVIGDLVRSGHVVVTQGFLGGTLSGVVTTIGRGGSDYSAAIFGAALDAEEIQIWTDVDGMMTSDPSKIKGAQLIKEMTFREAAELAYFGAKVLHPSTITPAVQKNIPVRILNSRRPSVEGTVIVREPRCPDPRVVKSIAYKGGITLINIISTRMLMMHGFLAKVFEIFARFERSVDVLATSEVSLSLTVDSDGQIDGLLEELRKIADVEVSQDKAIFCVVGETLKKSKGVVPRIFSTLEDHDISVSMISLGASEINVTFVVDGKDIQRTAETLHNAFFGQA
jgi:aspartate kinase